MDGLGEVADVDRPVVARLVAPSTPAAEGTPVIGRDRIQYKSPDQVRLMRRAGLLVGQTLQRLREASVAGAPRVS